MYTIERTGNIFTVGFFILGKGFKSIKDCDTQEHAMCVIHFLNGGCLYDEKGNNSELLNAALWEQERTA